MKVYALACTALFFCGLAIGCEEEAGKGSSQLDARALAATGAAPAGSCASENGATSCGGKSAGDCYCDDSCAGLGDCCADKGTVCGLAGPLCGPSHEDGLCTVPAPICVGDALVRFEDATCEKGACQLDFSQEKCPNGCVDGACAPPPADPCAGVVCHRGAAGGGCSDAAGKLAPYGDYYTQYAVDGVCKDGNCVFSNKVYWCGNCYYVYRRGASCSGNTSYTVQETVPAAP